MSIGWRPSAPKTRRAGSRRAPRPADDDSTPSKPRAPVRPRIQDWRLCPARAATDLVSDELIRLSADRRVIVLTHDSRINDTLVAKNPDTDVRTLTRDANGSVIAQERRAPWVSLVEEATRLLDLPDIPSDLGKMPVLVRGMCRHAVDGALRSLALRWAVLAHTGLLVTVDTLDKKSTTKARFTHARRYSLPDRPGVADEARAQCEAYLRIWNEAAHDTGGSSTRGLAEEVAVARRTCELLDVWGRP